VNEIEKLRHLIEHWLEHNEEHAKVYEEWAQRAESFGKPQTARLLKDIASGTRAIDKLLKEAKKSL